jgi:hypothetical protein
MIAPLFCAYSRTSVFHLTHSSAAVLPLRSKGKMVSWSALLGEHVLSKFWVRDRWSQCRFSVSKSTVRIELHQFSALCGYTGHRLMHRRAPSCEGLRVC